MVLRTLPFLLAVSACLPQRPVVRLPEPTRLAVAWVIDDATRPGELAVPPPTLQNSLTPAFETRGLVGQMIPAAELSGLATQPNTERRLALVRTQAAGMPLLLIETQARFFSQLNGRYRFRVVTRLTLQDAKSPENRLQDEFENAALLDFDHERELEAVIAVAPRIAERVARLLDQFFAIGTSSTTTRVTPPPTAEVIYFVLVDRFANGDSSNDFDINPKDPSAWHGGDIKGLMGHLDELQALGVTTLWLSPILASRDEAFFGHGAFHGYWVNDFDALNRRFGSPDDFLALKRELDRRGMRLVLDTVLNHVGYGATLVDSRPEFFHGQGPIANWNDLHELTDHDVHGLPDLAQEREPVYQFLLAQSTHWYDFLRPAGFRLDAVKHIPTSFWRRYTADLRAHAGNDFMLLGEIFEGDPAKLAQAKLAGGFSHVLDFPLHYAMKESFCDGAPVGRIAATLFADRAYADPNQLVTFLDNHDLPRLVSACHNDVAQVKLALAFMLAMRGVPALTYGTEVGLTGMSDPDNRGDMRFAKADDAMAHDLTTSLQQYLAARRAHPVLATGTTHLIKAAAESLVWLRVNDQEVALVALNRGSAPLPLAFPEFADVAAVELPAEAPTSLKELTIPARALRVVAFAPSTPTARDSLTRMVSPEPATRPVRFAVDSAALPQGELYLTGLGHELGDWQAAAAHGPLGRDGSAFVSTLSLPVGGLYEFKLVTKNRDEATYESRPNRYLFVTPGPGELHVKLTWNRTDSEPS